MSTPDPNAPIFPPFTFKTEADPDDPMRLRAVLDAGHAAAELARWARQVEEGRYTAELVRLGWTPPGAGADATPPTFAPFGVEITAPMIHEVWDAFVKPTQSDDAPPQSVEVRVLMGILRWAHDRLSPAACPGCQHTTPKETDR